ncbi:helix-turn-helix transcriptional regulator [Chitinophaga sp. Mgbs1]|uniref:Helix-turn-helix transcriptional regulator n=1 Tax=Chitinophaga solisilvae TaxID=1233460 RepID=A0A3S1B4R5_9BACT|nr:helix-turn-helix transcriptional regulator [Chitinophaga solisilvae]
MQLNERILRARKERGLTQEELADLVGVTVRTIQRIERNESVPRSYTLKAIAAALNLPFETLTADRMAEAPVPAGAVSADTTHFLQVFNLSCFAYLLLPWIHFLVPSFLLRRQKNLETMAVARCRKIIRQQLYWMIALHVLMLFTFLNNYIQVTVSGNRQYIISYMWAFLVMYLLNAGVIFYNGRLIQKQLLRADGVVLTGK